MRWLSNILWLALKEFRTLWRDATLLLLVIYAFGPGMYIESSGAGDMMNNAAVTFVDEDRSPLSRALQNALLPPRYLPPAEATADRIDPLMDWGETTFVVVIPPDFEADVLAGRAPSLQINIDATKTMAAAVGTGYLSATFNEEIRRYAAGKDVVDVFPVDLVLRRSFNPAGNDVWLRSVSALLDWLSILAIVLTGAALIREREHGTLEHLMVMPVTAIQIALAKITANALVVFVAFVFSLFIVVQGALDVPIAGSEALLLAGAGVYIFAAASIGVLLGILARSMAQFALLLMMMLMPMMLLSGGVTPIESQPVWLQPITWLLPSRHFMSFATSIAYRGAGFGIVWTEFLWTFLLGAAFLALSLVLFRRSVAGGERGANGGPPSIDRS